MGIKNFIFGQRFFCRDCVNFQRLSGKCKAGLYMPRREIAYIRPFAISSIYIACDMFKFDTSKKGEDIGKKKNNNHNRVVNFDRKVLSKNKRRSF